MSMPSLPGNGIYVVQGEMSVLLTAMRTRGTRWSHAHQDEENDLLIRNFSDLKEVLNQIGDLRELEPIHFLGPFLEVIRSEETTGPVTTLALTSIIKFLSYGLIDPGGKCAAVAVENIADVVTHARFVGTDEASDGVVLMNILQVLRTLMMSPEGTLLTNDMVCEIVLSCLRICFETRFGELLRRGAENCLKDMFMLLFTRLPTFSEDHRKSLSIKKLNMRPSSVETSRGKRRTRNSHRKSHWNNQMRSEDNKASTQTHSDKVQESVTENIGQPAADEQDLPSPIPGETDPVTCTASVLAGSENVVSDLDETLVSSQSDAKEKKKEEEEPKSYVETSQGIHDIQIETSHSPLPACALSSEVDHVTEEQNEIDFESLTTSVINESNAAVTESNEQLPSVETPIADASGELLQVIPTGDQITETDDHLNQHAKYDENKIEPAVNKDSKETETLSAESDGVLMKETVYDENNFISENDVKNKSDSAVIDELSDADKMQVQTPVLQMQLQQSVTNSTAVSVDHESQLSSPVSESHEWFNMQGVRFMPQDPANEDGGLVPYGLVSVRELFRLIVMLCNPTNKENTDVVIQLGLTLLTVALQVGADSVGQYASILPIVKDDLCRNLFTLLKSERLSIFTSTLQVAFLLLESLRTHLKFQLERFLSSLTEIIISDSPKISYEQKEVALEAVVQMWRIPGLVTELYLNYDCDLYCPNLYEELTKLLSKNAFPVSGVYNTHLLSLDALLTIIDSIESHCNSRILNEKREQCGSADNNLVPAVQEVLPSPNYISRTGSRQKISSKIPSHEQLMAIKRKKKLLSTGTEHFNTKPKKGIQFLQDQHLLSSPLDPQEVVMFLRENPHLDKKMIGEFISNRTNLSVLDCFVKSFDFTDTRIDEALRMFLETFRLPGESPLIAHIMEHFADHWHKCNGEPFSNADAAFTLAYAVIMLNVDQHNHNVKKQNIPMNPDDFKRNLKNVNGGSDFDHDMLDDIYASIKNEEIVMPAEQTGLVRENYLWKVLLRRGQSQDGSFVHAPNGLFDHDLFSLIWGPTVAALCYVFDRSKDPAIYQKAISGFRKCAMISAHYGMSNVFDHIIASLCKFTMLLNSAETPDNLTISLGQNPKARLATMTVFNLAHRHGDIIREGWRNVLDCILQLYKCKLLPKILVEAEDFTETSGKISLMREEIQLNPKAETGLLSSIYSYISMGTEPNHKVPSPEDQEFIRLAQSCISECHLEQLTNESKFLRLDSLHKLIKALIRASYGPEGHVSLGSAYNEDTAVFFLELLLKVVIQNRDRVQSVWQIVRDHIYTLLMGAAACNHNFLVERSVVGLLRLAIRLMRREDMSYVVLQSLRMLLLLKGSTLSRVSRQVSYGLFELLKTSAANIHSATDWAIIFTLLECVGAGAPPPRVVGKPPALHDTGARSDGEVQNSTDVPGLDEDSGLGNERGCTSDSELSRPSALSVSPSSTTSPELSPNSAGGGWILVGREGEIQPMPARSSLSNQYNLLSERELMSHDPFSLVKCCESLAFLVRDVAHITPYNFENCVHCIRTFVEASLDSNEKRGGGKKVIGKETATGKGRKKASSKRKDDHPRARSPANSPYDADESDSEEMPSGYHQVSIQLLDLMHTLHTRTAQIYRWWAEENAETELTSLWAQGWCPLLQGIARLCCDSRRQVRMSAITYLQRALLVHDLQTLTGDEWESCFNKVLFPLLSKLLESINPQDPTGLEETRMRAATVLSKVFLHHLTPLQTLSTFTALWLTILDFMDKYMHADKSDLLYEAIPESLKNMLLVMDSAKVFSNGEEYSPLWTVTWDKINTFLPTLKDELFKAQAPPAEPITKQMPGKEGDPHSMCQNDNQQLQPQQQPQVVQQQFEQQQLQPQLQQNQHFLLNRPTVRTEIPLQFSQQQQQTLQYPGTTVPTGWPSSTPIFPHLGQMLYRCTFYSCDF
ncbi:sec7 domain-containing protein garz isoform X2 [Lycorma delicatula]|uniref:sec7 domain-containing protein garz isoform X2 n=1 Tax=Lycorma delicatula TaxID=130591 RepID=UPI003F512AEF